MLVYLSGPMSGRPNFNYHVFHEHAEIWRAEGFKVLNPAENFGGNQQLAKKTYMREDIRQILLADAVAVIDGWWDSEGSRLEVAVAQALDIPVYNAGYPDHLREVVIPVGTLVRLAAAAEVAEPDTQTLLEQGLVPFTRKEVFDFAGVADGGGYKSSMDDPSKPQMWLVPNALSHAAARALGHGAAKYAPNNWRRGMKWSEVYSALQRHLTAWLEDEGQDPDSGLSHLDHAAACLSFLTEYEAHQQLYGGFDNRFKRPKAA